MAEIQPFAAIRYASDANLAAVTCPPYDVLSPAERQALIRRSPHATARLILPEGDDDARYQNAHALWTEWLQSGVLSEDPVPGFYITRTEFDEPGAPGLRRHRLGLLCLLRLYPYGDRIVLPHEHTLSRPKEDRGKLLQATRANFEAILGLVDDADGGLYQALVDATTLPPLADFAGDDGQHHTLWKIENPENVHSLADYLRSLPVFIADGHHRYETALAYGEQNGALGTNKPEAFLLASLSSVEDPGLVVLPTHRLVRGVTAEAMASLFRHLEPWFEVQELGREDIESRLRLSVQNQPAFGLVLRSGTLYQVTGRDASQIDAALPADVHPALRPLDVTVLQHLVLDRVLGIKATDIATTDRLAYTRDVDEAIRRVHDGEFDLALLLGRPPAQAVRDVAQAGQTMPQKSTFFYPKLLSGLVMRRIG